MGRKCINLLCLLAIFTFSAALKVEEVPNPQTTRGSFVADAGGVLGPTYTQWLDTLSSRLEELTSAEMAIVTIDNLDDITVEEFAVRLFKRWGIGKKTQDNGILLLFSLYDRKVRIEVGYGLEPVLTDALSKRIIYAEGIPNFKNELYAQGLYRMAFRVAEVIAAAEGKTLGIALPEQWPTQMKVRPQAPAKDFLGFKIRSPWILAGLLPGAIFLISFVLFMYQLGRFQFTPAKAGKERALQSFGIPVVMIWALGILGGMIWGAVFETMGRTMLMTIGSAIGFNVFAAGIKKSRIKWLKDYHATCPECSSDMKLYSEKADNAFLLEEEIAEEKVKGMDYEFWRCPQCDLLERFEVKLPWAKSCPKCHRRTQLRTAQMLRSPTRSASGSEKITLRCHNAKCNFTKDYVRSIPKIAPPSSSSGSSWGGGSSSGSFGGGSSGGGGASGSW